MFGCIVVGVDGSVTAGQALTKAIELARLANARLRIATAFKDATAVAAAAEPIAGGIMLADRANAELSRYAETIVAKAAEQATGLDVKTYAIAGDPADVLLDLAEEEGADLIIVGNKGMRGAKRFLLGSVPNRVAHHASCNVLIVHTT